MAQIRVTCLRECVGRLNTMMTVQQGNFTDPRQAYNPIMNNVYGQNVNDYHREITNSDQLEVSSWVKQFQRFYWLSSHLFILNRWASQLPSNHPLLLQAAKSLLKEVNNILTADSSRSASLETVSELLNDLVCSPDEAMQRIREILNSEESTYKKIDDLNTLFYQHWPRTARLLRGREREVSFRI